MFPRKCLLHIYKLLNKDVWKNISWDNSEAIWLVSLNFLILMPPRKCLFLNKYQLLDNDIWKKYILRHFPSYLVSFVKLFDINVPSQMFILKWVSAFEHRYFKKYISWDTSEVIWSLLLKFLTLCSWFFNVEFRSVRYLLKIQASQ